LIAIELDVVPESKDGRGRERDSRGVDVPLAEAETPAAN